MERKKQKLTDVCTIQYGYAFDSKKFSDDSENIALIRIRDVKSGVSNTYYTGEYDKSYLVKEGEILVGMDGEFNIAKWKSDPAILNQRVCKISGKDNIVEDYLQYYLSLELKNIERRTSFVTVKHLSAKELNALTLEIHTYEEQKKIANQLKLTESIIEKRKQQLSDLDNLIKSRFVEMFGDPISNPNNYVYKSIGEVTKSITAGWSTNGEARIKQQHEKAVLKVSAVTQGFFKADEYKVIDVNEPIKKYVFPQKGDLLFSRANTREMVGATAIIEQDYPDLFLPDKLWKILFENTVNVYYMKFILSTPAIRAEFSAQSTGTSGSMYNVSMDKFKGIGIPIPPIELQIQFATFVHQVDKLKSEVQKSLNETQILFDSLMQEYFE